MAVITVDELSEVRKKHPGKKIVFCTGSFDLVHAGHILFFEDCKAQGDILVVSVGTDSIIRINKGENRPILNEHVRIKTIDSFKPVDYSLLDIISTKENPLLLLDVMMEKLKPDVYVVNADGFNMPYREEISRKHGAKLLVLDRAAPKEFDGISTSKIIEKIKSL